MTLPVQQRTVQQRTVTVPVGDRGTTGAGGRPWDWLTAVIRPPRSPRPDRCCGPSLHFRGDVGPPAGCLQPFQEVGCPIRAAGGAQQVGDLQRPDATRDRPPDGSTQPTGRQPPGRQVDTRGDGLHAPGDVELIAAERHHAHRHTREQRLLGEAGAAGTDDADGVA
jgi:hypothetical protein